jgi:CheY-like chemotaxis protein
MQPGTFYADRERSEMRRVLVVEDDPNIAELIGEDLSYRGYGVAHAANGAEALDQLDRGRPDAIVLDLMMPVMHGWDFVDHYQEKTGGELLPIVVVSAARAVPRSLEAKGVRRYLAKPFDLDELARSLSDVIDTPSPVSA